MREIIATGDAPKAIGPYSQAVAVGNLVFTAGQIPIDPKTGKFVEGGIAEQTAQVLRNLAAILQAAGTGLENVLKATVFLANMDDFKAMNEVYASFFPSEPPARAAVQAVRLPLGALLEIDMIAVRENKYEG